jgi:hypothetical protein
MKELSIFIIIILSFMITAILFLFWNPFLDLGLNLETFNDIPKHNQTEIPKVIHQISLSDNNNQWMSTWSDDYIKMYPGFKYVLWNSEKIDKELNWTKDMRKIYDLENEKGKSNIARLLILYQYGGIFIDENAIYLKKNNNDLTRIIEKAKNQQTNFFAAREPNQNYLSNNVIGSTSGNKVLSFMLNKLEELVEGYKEVRDKMNTNLITGNGLLTKADMYNYHITLIPEVMFYPPTRKWQQHRHIPNKAYMYNFNHSKNIEKDYNYC